ncbi:MAG: SDR family NAD(P)-dependent oxidoreductase [Puniceicoccaceae bacterium]
MKNSSPSFFESFDRVVITGGTSGIGSALLRQWGKLSGKTRFCNLSRSKPKDFPMEDRLVSIPCDLADRESARTAADGCRKWLGEKDEGGRILLINNSGFGCYGVFPRPTADRNLAMIDVNVRGPVFLTAVLGDLLRASRGGVVNIASTAAFQPTPYLAAYGATKAFLLHWSLGLAEEWKAEGVRVLAVCPGPTETAFFREAGFREAPLKKGSGQTADEVAAITLEALRKGKSLVTCGTRNRVMAAFSSKLPKPLASRLTGAIMRRLRLERFQETG